MNYPALTDAEFPLLFYSTVLSSKLQEFLLSYMPRNSSAKQYRRRMHSVNPTIGIQGTCWLRKLTTQGYLSSSVFKSLLIHGNSFPLIPWQFTLQKPLMRDCVKTLLKIQIPYSIRIAIIHMLVDGFKKKLNTFLRNIFTQQKLCVMQYIVFVQVSINLSLHYSFTVLPLQKADLQSIDPRSLWSPS